MVLISAIGCSSGPKATGLFLDSKSGFSYTKVACTVQYSMSVCGVHHEFAPMSRCFVFCFGHNYSLLNDSEKILNTRFNVMQFSTLSVTEL